MPASKDPKSYVKPVPLPIPACNGLKLLARDTINFNPEFPSREDVRKNNYNRRQNQMSNMGFKSVSHKPYMGIGDPFYLDEKKMILHALGQWTEENASSSSSSEESDDDDNNKDAALKPAFTAAKFVLRRSRKDLNTLNKAVVHGRNMIRNVSLGHGLFDLINKEKQSKQAAEESAFKKKQEQLRNEFQPPKKESDDETDEDLDNDVDLTNYMVPVAPPTFLTQQQTDTDEELGIVNDNASESDQSPEREPEFVTFSGMALAEDEEEFVRARSAAVTSEMTSSYSRPVSRKKKKQETPRPYTPQHTNLSANISTRESVMDGEEEMDITKDALFRQLCVLHWILEAMSTDPPSAMTPIMSCWSLTDPPFRDPPVDLKLVLDIGGSRAQQKKIQKDKVTESQWASFLSKDTTRAPPRRKSNMFSTMAKVSKRLSTQRMSRSPHIRRPLHTPGRNSGGSSATGSQQGSTTEGGAVIPPGISSKLASLLKPRLSIDRNASPTMRVPSAAANSRSPSPSHKPQSKMAAFFNLKSKSNEGQGQTGENKEISPNSSQLSGPGNVDANNNPEKTVAPSPTPKLTGFFKKKPIETEIKPNTPPQNLNLNQSQDSANHSKVKPEDNSSNVNERDKNATPTKSPMNKMANLMNAKRKSVDETNQSQDNSRSTPTPSKQKVAPKLAAILKPRTPTRSSLGGAASLAQFLELKMRGGLNTMTSQMSMLNVRNRSGVDEEPLSPRVEEEEDQAYNKSIFKFLDEYYESLKLEEDGQGNKQLATKSPSSTPPISPTPVKDKKNKEEKKKKKKKREDSGEKRLDHKVAVALGEEEKLSSKYLRANAHLIRAKSSPALTEFQNTLPSKKKVTLTADLHNQFAECREEKALTLHDIIDHKVGQRMLVCKSKFLSFQGMRHRSSFHRAVEEMRVQSWQRLRKPVSERKKSQAKGNWYTDLMEKIPEELKQEWYYTKILQKLANFGLVEGTGKQSIYKFIKVLEGLREWEICSPDITAAIEFCRERIVEMTIEEYESWFTQRFPKITRPQTAPPAPKTEKKTNILGSASSMRRVMPKRPTQSAFVRRVQR